MIRTMYPMEIRQLSDFSRDHFTGFTKSFARSDAIVRKVLILKSRRK